MKKTSVIIVDYQNKIGLKKCLNSINSEKEIETIVIDNNEINRGFSKACNLGAEKAGGDVLLFLNPDSQVDKSAIGLMVKKLMSDDAIGILGPKLVDKNRKAYLSFTKQPSRLCAFVVYSFLNKWFGNNKCSREYWYIDESLEEERLVGSVSGAALMIRKSDFLALKGFDEDMFMYWEDYDLCDRTAKLGKNIVYFPGAVVRHDKAGSTPKNSKQVSKWFKSSRHHFFRKKFGSVYALFLEIWLRTTENYKWVISLALMGVLMMWVFL